MTDLRALIDDLCEGLRSDPAPDFPGFPGPFPGGKNSQFYDYKHFSRSSRLSRSENEWSQSEIVESPGFSADAHARTSSRAGEPGKPGNPGKDGKSLAETSPPPFPVKILEPGKPGNQEPVAGAFPSLSNPLPISADDVRAGVVREIRALADLGLTGLEAERRAIAITRAKIGNSEALAERQASGSACHVCDGALDDTAPVIAILIGKRGSHLHLHADCHDAYRVRRRALVERIMAAAGYGDDQQTGDAA